MAAKKRSKNGKAKKPSKKAGNGPEDRDSVTGQFLPGWNGGPGRPKGFDFRKVVAEKARDDGLDLEDALYEVAKSMLNEAMAGDVAAAKFFADRLCGLLRQEHEIVTTSTVHVADQARADLREMLANGDVQDTMLGELRRRTMGDGDE